MDHPAFVGGRYALDELIGRGGMGEVHAAWDLRLERPVAIKTLREDVAAQRSVRRRFEAEARSAARLVHPNVVAVYDSGEADGIPYMVMELLSGRSLRDEIASGPMQVSEVRSLASQVLGALAAAHSAGIVHRDIKPANILMTEDGRWKVSDFGIAKSVQMQDADETVTGMVLGTPAYLAPERLFGGEASPAGDVYSLGVILYEALAGRRPFHADSPEGWAAVIAAQAPEPLAAHRPDVPPAIVAVIEKSVSRDPAGRFTSASEMADALGARAAGPPGPVMGGAAKGSASWREVAPAGSDETAPLASATQVPATTGKDRRRRGLASLAGGAVIAAIVGVSVAAASGGGSPATETQLPPTTPATAPTTVPQTAPPATAPPATAAPATAPAPPAKGPHGDGGGGPGKGGDGGGHGGHGGGGG